MKTANIFLFFILLSANTVHADEKVPLNKDNIVNIYIYKNTDKIEKLYLNEHEESEFIENWNGSNERGLCKFRATAWIIVRLNNGNTRKFRLSGNNIKEDSDYCYTINRAFSRKLYEKLN